MQQMHDNIPYLFDYWSDPGVYLHLLKSPPPPWLVHELLVKPIVTGW